MKYNISLFAFMACLLMMSYTSLKFYPKWKCTGGEAAISYDVSGYYWYLPSIFIYKDLKHQSFKDDILNKYSPTPPNDFQQGFKLENGNYCMKYSSGMAVMFSPFFLTANLLAKPLGYPQDGFSPPYQLAIQLGGLFIALLGLWFFRKLFLLFYGDNVVAICLVLLVFGTNYLDYGAVNIGMSHSWLFTLYVLLLLNTYYFYRTFQYKYAVGIGIFIGLATLTRPTEILSCIIPLLWGLERISFKVIATRLHLLWSQWRKILLTLIFAGLVISIQLIYWKYVSGHWLVYSYQNQGFSWRHPHVIDYTFNYATGWLMYTPAMILAFLGIFTFIRNGKNRVAILCFFLLSYYIVSAWDVWQYGGRAMVQSYPVLFFPLASLIDVLSKRRIVKWIALPVVLSFTYINLWAVYFSHRPGPINWSDSNTATYFWKTLGTWNVPQPDIVKLRDDKDFFYGAPKHMQLLYENNFENDSIYCPLPAISGCSSLYLDTVHKESKQYFISYQPSENTWIRAQALFKCKDKEWEPWKMTQFVIRFYNKEYIIKERIVRLQRFLEGNKVTPIFIDAKIPDQSFDRIGIMFLNDYTNYPILIDDLKIWSFR